MRNEKQFNFKTASKAGILSGIARRKRRFEKYRAVLYRDGSDIAFKLCARDYYRSGYSACERKYR